LSQGPGFANLGALGLLSNRVLQPFLGELGSSAESDANYLTGIKQSHKVAQ
jgi:hypothetical protein